MHTAGEVLVEAFLHTLSHTWPLIPFLYITYLLMELLERKAGHKAEGIICSAGKAGPLLGGLLGAVPQCGMSAAGASFYSARLITPGTLIALFLATSDEMIPIMISSKVPPLRIVTIVAVKVAVGIAAGFAVDLIRRLFKQKEEERDIGAVCREGECHCEGRSVWLAALIHTATVTLTVFLVSLALHLILHLVGEDVLAKVLNIHPLLTSAIAALVGLIPNCASSVALTELHIAGGLSTGALLAGLLTGAGAGVLVLLRVNRPVKDSLRILLVLYVIGVVFGAVFDYSGIGAVLGIL